MLHILPTSLTISLALTPYRMWFLVSRDFWICQHVCLCIPCAPSGRREEGTGSFGAGFTDGCEPLWVLGVEQGSPGRAAGALPCRASLHPWGFHFDQRCMLSAWNHIRCINSRCSKTSVPTFPAEPEQERVELAEDLVIVQHYSTHTKNREHPSKQTAVTARH